jgi:site-specific DNA-methyltransferase (adenine-specific)
MLKKESKKNNTSPCMVVFCDFWDQFTIREIAKKHGLNGCINLVFQKSYSSQVLKANMRIVSNGEYGLLLYRDKLPKFNNNGKMIYNIMPYRKTLQNELMGKIHPTQKPVDLLEYLIKIFTDENDVVIDPCAGSGSTLIACVNTNRKGYGFEIKKKLLSNSS